MFQARLARAGHVRRTIARLRARASALALALLGGLALPARVAALYKWIDANGRVVYSDQPPPGNVKAEIVAGRAAARRIRTR